MVGLVHYVSFPVHFVSMLQEYLQQAIIVDGADDCAYVFDKFFDTTAVWKTGKGKQ